MSVLVLGLASYPSIIPLDNVAFAQEDIQIELKEEIGISAEVEEAEEEEENGEEAEEEKEIEIEVEVEDGTAKVEVEIGDEEFEFEFELVSTELEDIREEIISKILAGTDLTVDQIGEFEIEFEEEENGEREKGPRGDKIEICHIPPGNPSKAHTITVGGHAIIKHLSHGDVIGPCDGIALSAAGGESILGDKQAEREARLAEKEARLADKQAEREAKLADKQAEREDRLAERQMEFEARLAEKESQALQRADELIQKLEQRIADLELRLQTLLNKVETGEYFGNISQIDPVINSYSISIDGTASSLFDESVTTDVSGEIFIDNLVTGSEVSKFKATGGEIFVGDNIYDVVFGKARISSSGSSGEKDTMVLILQTIDSDGNGNTIRLTLDFESALEGDFGTEPIELQIIKNSKISGQWSLSASGQLSLLQA